MPAPNLAEILSKISDGLSVFDKDLGLTFVNDKAASILEAADEAFHNRLAQTLKDHAPIRFDHFHASMSRWFEMTPQEYDQLDANARHEITADGVFAPYEKEFVRKDGSRVPVLIGGVATQNDPVETLCLAQDLSERRRAEDRMRNLVECGK